MALRGTEVTKLLNMLQGSCISYQENGCREHWGWDFHDIEFPYTSHSDGDAIVVVKQPTAQCVGHNFNGLLLVLEMDGYNVVQSHQNMTAKQAFDIILDADIKLTMDKIAGLNNHLTQLQQLKSKH